MELSDKVILKAVDEFSENPLRPSSVALQRIRRPFMINTLSMVAGIEALKPPIPAAEFVQRMLAGGVVRGTEAMRAPGCVRLSISTTWANQAFIKRYKQITSLVFSCL